MQLLRDATSPPSDEDCARDLLDAVPQVMANIRKHMRQHRSGLTVPQFRTLCYVSTYPACSLSAVAEFIGLSLAAMSRLVEGLVVDKFMERKPGEDRRHVELRVTSAGQATVAQAREIAQNQLAKSLEGLTSSQRTAFATTMQILRQVFTPETGGACAVDPTVLPNHDARLTVKQG